MKIESEDAVFLRDYNKAKEKYGSQRALCKAFGIPRTTLQDRLRRVTDLRKTSLPRIHVKPFGKEVRRYILSSAQNGTQIHEGFFNNLQAYADYLGAEILISGFTYNKSLFSDHEKNANRYHNLVEPYLTSESHKLGPQLVFCGEMNTLPTAVTPLSGFETYTRSNWGIFPHVKVQLKSVPTMKHDPSKQILTTGAVTLPNYIQKRDGIKATFHHVIGAVVVEITPDGRHFCRHIQAEHNADGSFYDLGYGVKNGRVFELTGNDQYVEAITWGDLHYENRDRLVVNSMTGLGKTGEGILGDLGPRLQFFHDVIDFSARNHHTRFDPHHMYQTWWNGRGDIKETILQASEFIADMSKWAPAVVIESNHDQALLRWLKEADWKLDPTNMRLFFELQLAMLDHIENKGNSKFSPFRELLMDGGGTDSEIIFVPEDESYTICDGEIECGMHGHLGANGAKGTPGQYTKMGPKANTGHTHSANIIDGIYTTGTSSKLDLGYNKGLSSWSHSHIVTYRNGKRAIITMQDEGYRA